MIADPPMPDRPYLLERVDDAAVVQLYAPGFDRLSLNEKLLVWHLYEAALAGRDIYLDQRYAHSLEMRAVLEAIIRHDAHVDRAALAEIRRYTKLFWLNNGPFNNLTARKFVLRLTEDDLRAAVHAAAGTGARFPTASESLDALVHRLAPFFLDPAVDPVVTNKTPGEGRDILRESANNLYRGVTMADLEAFEERYPLNARLVKQGAALVEEVYRPGSLYGPYIAKILVHLERARPYATAAMRTALDALIRWYRTGEADDALAYDIAWVADQASPVDTINGFVEVYMDPRGRKGSWEALVYYVHPEKTEGVRRIAESAQWFEDHMPWDPKYRREQVTGVSARAIEVVVESGDSAPITPIGINLPNDQHVREVHGSKSVSLSNVVEAYDRSMPEGFRTEFSWTPEEADRARKWGSFVGELTTNLHEIIGHGSGKVAERLAGNPQLVLKEQYSALEESRADLVALYFLPDPRLVELGLVPAGDRDAIVLAEYEGYARNALVQLRRIREGTVIEEDHMRNRQMIVHWLIANTRAIDVRKRDGKTYYVVVDPEAFREGVGVLLAEVQRIKAEGDYEAARALFETHGIHFDAALRDEIVRRVDALDLPSYTGFVQPRLEPVRNDQGTVVDVHISYPLDLTMQMLEYSALYALGGGR